MKMEIPKIYRSKNTEMTSNLSYARCLYKQKFIII